METILWGSNISTNYGDKDLSLTYSGYDYLKLWVGGDTFGARYSKPIILPCNETNKYLVGCVNTGGESANVTITPTKLTYSSSANNYQKITGVVGIKINSWTNILISYLKK